MEVPFSPNLHCVCGVVYMLKHTVAPILYCHTSLVLVCDTVLVAAHTVHFPCSPPPPFRLPKEFSLLFTQNSLPTLPASVKRLCLLRNLLQAPPTPFFQVQHPSPSCIAICLCARRRCLYSCFPRLLSEFGL